MSGSPTQRQETFCLAYIELGNASEAYRRAYQAKRMSAKTVHECASRLLADRKVSARVAELRVKAIGEWTCVDIHGTERKRP